MTDSMAYGGLNRWTPPRNSRGIPKVSTIQPEYADEQADSGRDCRTRFARPNFQALTRTGKYFPRTADWQPYSVDLLINVLPYIHQVVVRAWGINNNTAVWVFVRSSRTPDCACTNRMCVPIPPFNIDSGQRNREKIMFPCRRSCQRI